MAGVKFERTCRQCLVVWTIDKAHEERLAREAADVGGMVTDILNVDVTKMLRNRFKIGLSQSSRANTTLSNRAIASQELKSMRRCPSCRTPDYYDQKVIEVAEESLLGLTPPPVAQTPLPETPVAAPALRTVDDFLQELDRLLDQLTTGKISSEEYTQRRQQIMKFIEMV